MPPIQTTYGNMSVAREGEIAELDGSQNIISRIIESAAGVGFGKPVFQGANDRGIIAAGAITYDVAASAVTGTGNGVLTLGTPKFGAGVRTGAYKVVFIEPVTNLGTFEVEDPDGVVIGTGVVGALFNNQVRFTIADGATDFLAGDYFVLTASATGNSNARFIGITTRDRTVSAYNGSGNGNQYDQYDNVSVLQKGPIWVVAGANVVAGDSVYVVPGTGAYTNVVTDNIAIARATFETSGSSSALVIMRLK